MTKFKRVKPSQDADINRAEQNARAALYQYFRRRHGIQKELSLATGIVQPMLSRLANAEDQPIALEAAIKIDVATKGELRAEMLCPSEAALIGQFLESRRK